MSTVGFRWSWAWNDERGEWEFEKKTKITQYRHNINTSIKKRVILSFYNVSCSLSDTWFADKRKNIFFTQVQPNFFSFLIWRFYDFWFFSIQIGSPAKHAAEKSFPFSNSRQSRLKRSERSVRFFCTKFRANRKTGRIFPPHVSQGTPAFLKITFQLHRNPAVLYP